MFYWDLTLYNSNLIKFPFQVAVKHILLYKCYRVAEVSLIDILG